MRIRFVTPPPAKQVGGIENALKGLREALQRHGVEVLEGGDLGDTKAVHHFHGLWNPLHSRLATRLRKLGQPYVISPHGMLEPWAFSNRRFKKLPYFWLVERRFLSGAESLFVTSRMEADNVARLITHEWIQVLPLGCADRNEPNYTSARQTLGWQPGERVLLFLSRIDVKKGLDILLQAMAHDCGWAGWRLVIVGNGDSAYIASLKAMTDDAAACLPKVEWVGPVWGKERWTYLQGADLFCLPSHSENFGIAVLEALHAGTPVITTDATPWRDYSNLDGIFIAKPKAASIQQALFTARRRIEMRWADEERRRVAAWAEARFAWERLAPAYLDAYRKVMSPARPGKTAQ